MIKQVKKNLQLLIDMVVNEMPPKRKMIYKLSRIKGLVTRERFEEIPPRVEYSLTPIAKDFLREISYVIEWGQLHFEQIEGQKIVIHIYIL